MRQTEVFALLHFALDVSLYFAPDEVWTVAVICMEPRAKAKRPLRNWEAFRNANPKWSANYCFGCAGVAGFGAAAFGGADFAAPAFTG